MFDKLRIAHIATQGKAESWPYPKIFHALKEAGVTSHEVWVEEFHSIYKNGAQEWREPLPEGFQPLKTNNDFDEVAVQEALLRRINHETTYVEFLRDITSAGVLSYKVDMSAQTVTYIGKREDDFFIQYVPPYTE